MSLAVGPNKGKEDPDQIARFGSLAGSLTHLSRMNFPFSVDRMSLFQMLGVLGGIFHFYLKVHRIFCKRTAETLIRRGG